MKKAVLFDLDGTVLASQPGIYHSIAYALEKLHLPLPKEEELVAFLGPPLTVGFSQVCRVPEELIGDAVRFYRENYNAGGMFEAYLFDGVVDMLNTLAEHGVDRYITTSKPEVFAKQILAHFACDNMFNGIYGSELNGERVHKSDVLRHCMSRESLSEADVVLVGDRKYDVIGAQEVGIPCVGVTYGYGTNDELQQAGATFIVSTPEEATALLLSL